MTCSRLCAQRCRSGHALFILVTLSLFALFKKALGACTLFAPPLIYLTACFLLSSKTTSHAVYQSVESDFTVLVPATDRAFLPTLRKTQIQNGFLCRFRYSTILLQTRGYFVWGLYVRHHTSLYVSPHPTISLGCFASPYRTSLNV